MKFSGLVAILDENKNFVEVRDLGPIPIDTKPGRVVALDEYKSLHPELFPEPEVIKTPEVKEIPEEVFNKVIQFLKDNPEVAEIIGDRLNEYSLGEVPAT